MKVMVWNAARGGMRSVVEAYRRDGFLEREGVTLVHSYADASAVGRQVLLTRALARFTWLLATRRVSLVHCHAAMRGSFWRKSLFARIARLRGVPVLFHLHGSEMKVFFDKQPGPVRTLIAAELAKADRVLVLSESWRSYVQSIAPAARLEVIPNYVTVPPATVRPDNPETRVVFLGLLGHRKGIFDLLEALAMALPTAPGLRLTVGGNGQLAEATALAAKLGIADQVTFGGWIDGDAKLALLESADVFVLPSYNEGLPMSVLEAMAHGLPVITTDVGGIPELVTHDVDGLLIAPGDRAALSQALIDLAGDRSRRERLGRAARARVLESFSEEVALGRLTAVYRAVERPGGRSARTPDENRDRSNEA